MENSYPQKLEVCASELEFDADALDAIAEEAIKRETGARGLRSILEETLGQIMFEIPGSAAQGLVRITRGVVDGTEQAVVTPIKAARQEKSA